MCEEHHDSDYQQHVNGAAISVKGQESKQPRAVNIFLSCSLAGLRNLEHATVPLPGSNEQSAILVAKCTPCFSLPQLSGNSSPSRRTYHRGRGPSPLDVSLLAVADKLDNFCATYSYLSFRERKVLTARSLYEAGVRLSVPIGTATNRFLFVQVVHS